MTDELDEDLTTVIENPNAFGKIHTQYSKEFELHDDLKPNNTTEKTQLTFHTISANSQV